MKRVLVVEDEAAIREFEVINLKRGGYDVVEAGDGAEALRLFDESGGDFDIALLDITMPEMDGFSLCKELRRRTQTLGIIMLTARTQEMDKISGLMLGADDYITKPFNILEVKARIKAIMRRVEPKKETSEIAKVVESRAVFESSDHAMFEGFTEAEMDTFLSMLARIDQNLDAAGAPAELCRHAHGKEE